MKPNTDAFEKFARKTINEVFAEYKSSEPIEKSVYLPKNDPGKWSPRSMLIVNHEHGIPNLLDYHGQWEEVESALAAKLGYSVYFEPINSAVMALWKI